MSHKRIRASKVGLCVFRHCCTSWKLQSTPKPLHIFSHRCSRTTSHSSSFGCSLYGSPQHHTHPVLVLLHYIHDCFLCGLLFSSCLSAPYSTSFVHSPPLHKPSQPRLSNLISKPLKVSLCCSSWSLPVKTTLTQPLQPIYHSGPHYHHRSSLNFASADSICIHSLFHLSCALSVAVDGFTASRWHLSPSDIYSVLLLLTLIPLLSRE